MAIRGCSIVSPQGDPRPKPRIIPGQCPVGSDQAHRVSEDSDNFFSGDLDDGRRIEQVARPGDQGQRLETDEERPGAGEPHLELPTGDAEGVAPSLLVMPERDRGQVSEKGCDAGKDPGIEEGPGAESEPLEILLRQIAAPQARVCTPIPPDAG